ncbi:MAG: uracil-DNA glycosylase [Xanthomonadales bacterium]|nr:uracil-DNA glycosylase [Xanthomonadales bacterium]
MNTAAAATDRLRLEPGWKRELAPLFETEQMISLRSFLRSELAAGKTVYPPPGQIFAAFDATPFEAVRVVILGQDPYHGPGQAHGLCFSVPPRVPVPPSLRNILAEVHGDLGIAPSGQGCLMHWARQGVLLLNAVLTVERGRAGAHQGRGWEQFTDAVIARLDEQREHLVFMLWGAPARAKGRLVDSRRHLVLRAPHPSPLSAHRGFFGCRHFSRCNAWLQAHGMPAIDWSVPG